MKTKYRNKLQKAKLRKMLRQMSEKCYREGIKADRSDVLMADALFGASSHLDKAIHYLNEDGRAT